MPGESLTTVARTPLVTAADVRDLTGYTKVTDLPDAVINKAVLDAQGAVFDDLATRHHDVPLCGTIDGVNTRFALPRDRKARVILDYDANANESSDAAVALESPPTGDGLPTYATAAIASVDALRGIVTLTAAPAPTVGRVLLSAYFTSRPIPKDRVQTCIKFYAAHLVDRYVRGPGRVALANPNAETKDQVLVVGSGWMKLYKDEVAKLRGTKPRAATRKTSLPGGDDLDDARRHT